MRIVIIGMLMLLGTGMVAQEQFFGLFVKDSLPGYHYSDAMVVGDFYQLDDSLERSGYVLSDWNVREGKELACRGIWRPATEGEGAGVAPKDLIGWESFIKTKRTMVKEGYLMSNVNYYTDMIGMGHYLGKWRRGETVHKVWRFSSFERMRSKVRDLKKDEFVLREIEVNLDANRNPVFVALFYKKEFLESYTYCYEGKDLKTFREELLRREKSGFYLSDIEIYRVKGKPHFVGIFEKGKRTTVFVANLAEDAFYSEWEDLEKKGFVLLDLEW